MNPIEYSDPPCATVRLYSTTHFVTGLQFLVSWWILRNVFHLIEIMPTASIEIVPRKYRRNNQELPNCFKKWKWLSHRPTMRWCLKTQAQNFHS